LDIAAVLARGDATDGLVSVAVAVQSPLVLNRVNAQLLARAVAGTIYLAFSKVQPREKYQGLTIGTMNETLLSD
jgi:hypothetical protein